MPLEEGKSREAFSHNVETEMNHGHPQKQAVAIAYSERRKAGGDDRPEEFHDEDIVPTLPEGLSVADVNDANRKFWEGR